MRNLLKLIAYIIKNCWSNNDLFLVLSVGSTLKITLDAGCCFYYTTDFYVVFGKSFLTFTNAGTWPYYPCAVQYDAPNILFRLSISMTFVRTRSICNNADWKLHCLFFFFVNFAPHAQANLRPVFSFNIILSLKERCHYCGF